MLNMLELSPLKRHWLTRTLHIPIGFQGWDKQTIIDSTGKFPVEIDEWLDNVMAGKIIMNPGGRGMTGVGLLFDGSAGEGKTTHAVVALAEFIKRLPDDENLMREILHVSKSDFGYQFKIAQFMTYPEFMALKRSTYDGENEERRELQRQLDGLHGRAREDWLNVRVLVLDDLSKKSGTRHDNESFDELLRSRLDKGLPTIVTSNIMREDWGLAYEDESVGSFAYEAFSRVRIMNKDLRKSR
jgi:hypothetical protein